MEYTYRHILKDPPGSDELLSLAGRGGIPILSLVNNKSKNLKDLHVDLQSLSEQEVAQLLSANPKVMHRPLFTDGKRLVVGFKPELVEELLS